MSYQIDTTVGEAIKMHVDYWLKFADSFEEYAENVKQYLSPEKALDLYNSYWQYAELEEAIATGN